jgi:hypothetical protein
VHCIPEWVAVHAAVALDPHWLFELHATHAWLIHAWPA